MSERRPHLPGEGIKGVDYDESYFGPSRPPYKRLTRHQRQTIFEWLLIAGGVLWVAIAVGWLIAEYA